MGRHEVRIRAVFVKYALGHRVDVVDLRQEVQRVRDRDAIFAPRGGKEDVLKDVHPDVRVWRRG